MADAFSLVSLAGGIADFTGLYFFARYRHGDCWRPAPSPNESQTAPDTLEWLRCRTWRSPGGHSTRRVIV